MSNVLKQCEFEKSRLEAMFSKRQTQKKPHTHHVSHSHNHAHTQAQSHAHRTTHAHAHHADAHHAFLYAKVYTCSNYGRQGHFVKFCYDKLNALIIMFGFEKLLF